MSTRGSIVSESRHGVWAMHDVSTEPSLAAELKRVAAAGGSVVIDLSDVQLPGADSVLRTCETLDAAVGTIAPRPATPC